MYERKVLAGLSPFRGSKGDFMPCLSQLLMLAFLGLRPHHCTLCFCGHTTFSCVCLLCLSVSKFPLPLSYKGTCD